MKPAGHTTNQAIQPFPTWWAALDAALHARGARPCPEAEARALWNPGTHTPTRAAELVRERRAGAA